MPKTITLLGSTGSIGTQSLDVARMHGYRIFGLAANSRVEILQKQIEEFHPEYVAVVDPAACEKLDAALAGTANAPKLLKGPEGLRTLAAMDGPDVVLNAVVGIAGLPASLAAIESGHDLALANKESLVTGGHLVTDAVKKYGVKLLPVDSEHSAIFQCLQGCADRREIKRLILTCSGGPFFGKSREELASVTKADALRHPNWKMGAKITIDCATLMNKGLEVIEAHHLFNMPYDKIEVVVQPQSAIHSMVEYADGSVKAHLGTTDMRIPIQFALSYPDRWEAPVAPLDFRTLGSLEFAAPDEKTFRCLALARHAGSVGGTLPCVMNAANEIAVAAFLSERGSYLGIGFVIVLIGIFKRTIPNFHRIGSSGNRKNRSGLSLARKMLGKALRIDGGRCDDYAQIPAFKKKAL